tara:strand:- start:15222 stop:15554 length:333 start_codon:yes stop_codon:yes gene_type:complete
MSLKVNLLKVIDSALELAEECEQTIEVRGAIKQLKQAHGSISQHTEEVLLLKAATRPEMPEEELEKHALKPTAHDTPGEVAEKKEQLENLEVKDEKVLLPQEGIAPDMTE